MAVSRRSNFGYIPSRGRGKLKPGFVDYGKVIGDTFNLDGLIEQRKVKETEYAENIENSPIEVDVAKVQDNLEGGLSNYLMQMKMDASEGARLVRDNKVGSAKYDDGQQMMKKARSNMANLDKQFSALQAISLEDIENIQKDMYSEGNKVDNAFDTMSLLSKGQLGPERIYYKDGQIYIKNGGADNKDVAFSDLKLRFLKDSKSMGDVTSTYTNLFNNATKTGRRYNDSLDSVSINNILENANSQGRRSLAFDWKLPFNQVDEAGNITPSQLSYANSEEAKAVARSLGISEENISNGNYTEWMRDVNNDDLLQKELLNYYNGKFRTAVNGAADVYDQKIQAANQQRIAEIEARKNNNNNNSGISKYTKETIEGVNSIINNPIDTLKTSGLELTKGMSDFDSKNYEEKYFTKLALNVAGANKDTNVLNFSDARRQFLKNSIAIEGAVNKIKEDGKRDQEAEPLLEFMAKIMDGSYNKNLGGGKNYFIDGNPSYMPQEFFTEVKKDKEGISYRQLTQQAQDLLTEIGYISSDYTEQVDVGTKRYKNFQAFIDDVKNMTFNRFVPGTGNLGPAKMFVFRPDKDGVDLRGLQGSILTEQGRNTLFNSIISSGLYTAAELRASGGNYAGPLSGNYNYTGSN